MIRSIIRSNLLKKNINNYVKVSQYSSIALTTNNYSILNNNYNNSISLNSNTVLNKYKNQIVSPNKYYNTQITSYRYCTEENFEERPRKSFEEMKKCQVFVSNFEFDVNWQELKDHFEQVAPVQFVKIFQNEFGKSRGLAVVTFEEEESVDQAISQLNSSFLKERNRTIFVKANTPRPAPEGPSVTIDNIPESANWRTVKEALSQHGEVSWVKLNNGKATVVFQSDEGAQAAIENGSVNIDGVDAGITSNQ
eukprot:TRINITY_DN15068_c0_g1_i1.p1 TRINITY_DN15068_c0_g1~~TRINITY_DN15068_c0_g1_i1.p1  ORF type:complete len:251 (+),score=90.76 TRINITY_DN15068_c0_g1_i1:1056-1808(+)